MTITRVSKPPKTVGELNVGDVFRSWNGSVCELVEKTTGRASIQPEGFDVRDVALGMEIVEVLKTVKKEKR